MSEILRSIYVADALTYASRMQVDIRNIAGSELIGLTPGLIAGAFAEEANSYGAKDVVQDAIARTFSNEGCMPTMKLLNL
jgi:hypothetical protein